MAKEEELKKKRKVFHVTKDFFFFSHLQLQLYGLAHDTNKFMDFNSLEVETPGEINQLINHFMFGNNDFLFTSSSSLNECRYDVAISQEKFHHLMKIVRMVHIRMYVYVTPICALNIDGLKAKSHIKTH